MSLRFSSLSTNSSRSLSSSKTWTLRRKKTPLPIISENTIFVQHILFSNHEEWLSMMKTTPALLFENLESIVNEADHHTLFTFFRILSCIDEYDLSSNSQTFLKQLCHEIHNVISNLKTHNVSIQYKSLFGKQFEEQKLFDEKMKLVKDFCKSMKSLLDQQTEMSQKKQDLEKQILELEMQFQREIDSTHNTFYETVTYTPEQLQRIRMERFQRSQPPVPVKMPPRGKLINENGLRRL